MSTSAIETTEQGELAIMGRDGDTKVYWTRGNAAETAAARATFDSLRAKGYLAYRLVGDGTKGEQLLEFDPNAQQIILAPAPVGG